MIRLRINLIYTKQIWIVFLYKCHYFLEFPCVLYNYGNSKIKIIYLKTESLTIFQFDSDHHLLYEIWKSSQIDQKLLIQVED